MSKSGARLTDSERKAALLEQLLEARAAAKTTKTAPLMDWIPQANPKYLAPRHLSPLIVELERAVARARTPGALTEQVTCSVPPRHGKTESILSAIAWGLSKRPELTFGYVSYSAAIAGSKSRKAQALAKRAGVKLASENVAEWRTVEGGGLLATGIGGQLTGHGLDIAIVDDPVKNRLEAESPIYRNRTWDWFGDVLSTRLEPGGTIIVNATRWHPDDLIGRLIGEEGDKWKQIRLPAISEDGKALWPERWPIPLLEERRARVGEYTWASLFQGLPRPRGGTLFGEPHTYKELPKNGVLHAIGVDLAYSAKTSSDWSVAVVMLVHEGLCYIVDVVRQQAKAPAFKAEILRLWKAHGKPVARWYAFGPERGIADFIGDAPDAVPVEVMQAPGDHFIRAQPFAAAWNRGAVLVPDDAPWLDEFLAEVCSFTGVGDDHDDQVDAASAAFDLLAPHLDDRMPVKPAHGTPEWAAAEESRMRDWAMRQVEFEQEHRGNTVRDFGFDPNDGTPVF